MVNGKLMVKNIQICLILIVIVAISVFVNSLIAKELVIVNPGDDLKKKVQKVSSGGEVRISAGIYRISETIYINKPGVTIRAKNRDTVRLVVSETFKEGPVIHVSAPKVTIDGIIIDGQFVKGVRGIRGSIDNDHANEEGGSAYLTIQNCELTGLTKHAIDIDGNHSVVRNTSIHKILRLSKGKRVDAHGIVTTHAKNLVIDNVDIRQCTGDAVQAERGTWDNLRIINSHLWDSPLEADMGGYKKGTYVSENAVDTKHNYKSRGRLAIINCNIHGFRSKLINNTSALNLKERVDVIVDSCEVYDSIIGLRLRGKSKGMEMFPLIMNTVVHNNKFAFRLENKLRKFRMFHCTIYENKNSLKWAPRRKVWSSSYYKWDSSEWLNINNLWIGEKKLPEISESLDLGAYNNLNLSKGQVDKKLLPLTPASAVVVPSIVYTWYEPSGRIIKDKKGIERKNPSTIGAYEKF